MQSTPWVFYHYPDLFEIKDSAYQFEFVGLSTQKIHRSADREKSRHQYGVDRVYDVGGGHDAVFGDLSIAGCGRRSYPANPGSRCIWAGRHTRVRSTFKKNLGN